MASKRVDLGYLEITDGYILRYSKKEIELYHIGSRRSYVLPVSETAVVYCREIGDGMVYYYDAYDRGDFISGISIPHDKRHFVAINADCGEVTFANEVVGTDSGYRVYNGYVVDITTGDMNEGVYVSRGESIYRVCDGRIGKGCEVVFCEASLVILYKRAEVVRKLTFRDGCGCKDEVIDGALDFKRVKRETKYGVYLSAFFVLSYLGRKSIYNARADRYLSVDTALERVAFVVDRFVIASKDVHIYSFIGKEIICCDGHLYNQLLKEVRLSSSSDYYLDFVAGYLAVKRGGVVIIMYTNDLKVIGKYVYALDADRKVLSFKPLGIERVIQIECFKLKDLAFDVTDSVSEVKKSNECFVKDRYSLAEGLDNQPDAYWNID